jgi:Flp pilus assembly secretin CpaC
MSTTSARKLSAALIIPTIIAGLTIASAAAAEEAPEIIRVNVDQAKLITMPQRIATVVIGNPLIADVTLQAGGIAVVTGKGYGATNVIAVDRQGAVVADRVINVTGPMDKVVTVYRGVNRESYSCMPICQRRMTLGDSEPYFKSTVEQVGGINSLVTMATRNSQ